MLQIIQGDVFEICVDFCRIERTLIERVVFASKDLGAERDAEECNGNYRIRFEGGETTQFPSGFARYDLTVCFVDGECLTVRHDEKIEVLKKVGLRKNE